MGNNICGYCGNKLRMASTFDITPKFFASVLANIYDEKILQEVREYHSKYLGGWKHLKVYICPKCRSLHIPAVQMNSES